LTQGAQRQAKTQKEYDCKRGVSKMVQFFIKVDHQGFIQRVGLKGNEKGLIALKRKR
jgi:hypothetical protein